MGKSSTDYPCYIDRGWEVDTNGSVQWRVLSEKSKKAFMEANDIQKSDELRLVNTLIQNVVLTVDADTYQYTINKQQKKTSTNSPTKSTCITKEGTLYCLAIMVTHKKGKPYQMERKNSHDRDDLDQVRAKAVIHDELHKLYHSDIPAFDKVSVGLSVHGVAEDSPSDYDDLTPIEIETCYNYSGVKYRHTHNNKNKSGSHHSFSQCTGKSCLVNFHDLLRATGDIALMNCAYGELSLGVMRAYTDTGSESKPMLHRGGGGCGRGHHRVSSTVSTVSDLSDLSLSTYASHTPKNT